MSAPSIAALQQAYRSGERRIADEVAQTLARIEASQAALSAYISWDAPAALAQAQAQDALLRRDPAALGPLHGVTVSVKDNIDVAGMVTTACSHSQDGAGAARCDAPTVARLRAAGAIILGKVNCHEYAFGGPAFDLPAPPASNPWKPAYFPGGSSSGSGVSVAARLCQASLGTDTAGSIRLPATHCGLVGLKPTYGALGLGGVRMLSLSLDHVGPLARDVDDCERIYQALCAPPAPAAAAPRGRAWRLAVPQPGWGLEDLLRPEVAGMFTAVQAQLAAAGVTLVPVALPALQALHVASALIMMAEVAYVFGPAVRADFDRYGRVFRSRALVGERIPAHSYLQAGQDRLQLTQALMAALGDVDALLLPGAASVAGPLAQVDTFYFLKEANLNAIANLTGQPALALPTALSADGLPMGIQLLGHHHQESRLLALGRALEALLAFGHRCPPSGFTPTPASE